ncbi:MAG TPA: hypothetical protein VKQ07_00640 [Jatrophihabitantaceae bacterium]|nr:hypothetical protein [Jatrophihabitantaceae bacterium]
MATVDANRSRGFDDGSFGGFDASERTLLSEHEQRAIERLDQQLERDAPELACLLRKMKARRHFIPSWLRRRS